MKGPVNKTIQSGFNLIELMIALLLSSICMQLLYASSLNMSRSTSVSAEKLDVLLKSQQLSYWFDSMLALAGRYNAYDQDNRLNTAKFKELEFITSQPVARVGSFINEPRLGVVDSNSDTLVINLMADSGCNGQNFNYADAELFHVVNEIYIEGNELRCRSYDGRYLTGITNTRSSFRSVGLLQGVASMQAKYLVASGSNTRLLDASELKAELSVKAIKLELWLEFQKQSTELEPILHTSWLEQQSSFSSHWRYQHLLLLIPVGSEHA